MDGPKTTLKPLILAVDDEEAILEILRLALEETGFAVHATQSPNEALRFYEQNADRVDLVLLDFVMPELPGDLVFEQLQQINPDVKVILLTGCDDHVAHKMFAKGLRGYVQKPFFIDDLVSRIRDTLEAP